MIIDFLYLATPLDLFQVVLLDHMYMFAHIFLSGFKSFAMESVDKIVRI